MDIISDDDVKATEGCEVLGPAYFTARRLSEQLMRGMEAEPLKTAALKAADDVGGEPLLMARIADLEKEIAHLRQSLEWARR